jgi:hypothetical protein
MEPAERIWWIKVFTAIGVACVTLAFQTFINLGGSATFMLGVLLYIIISDLLARYTGVDKTTGLKIGVGAFLFTWLMVWTLGYTLLRTMG